MFDEMSARVEQTVRDQQLLKQLVDKNAQDIQTALGSMGSKLESKIDDAMKQMLGIVNTMTAAMAEQKQATAQQATTLASVVAIQANESDEPLRKVAIVAGAGDH